MSTAVPTHLMLDETPSLAGAADVPLLFDRPERGANPLFLRRFCRMVVDPERGLLPKVAERDLSAFIHGAREGRALTGLRQAAESFAFAPNIDRARGRARWLAQTLDEYREAAGQRVISPQR